MYCVYRRIEHEDYRDLCNAEKVKIQYLQHCTEIYSESFRNRLRKGIFSPKRYAKFLHWVLELLYQL